MLVEMDVILELNLRYLEQRPGIQENNQVLETDQPESAVPMNNKGLY
jgi:hypothetical protein